MRQWDRSVRISRNLKKTKTVKFSDERERQISWVSGTKEVLPKHLLDFFFRPSEAKFKLVYGLEVNLSLLRKNMSLILFSFPFFSFKKRRQHSLAISCKSLRKLWPQRTTYNQHIYGHQLLPEVRNQNLFTMCFWVWVIFAPLSLSLTQISQSYWNIESITSVSASSFM